MNFEVNNKRWVCNTSDQRDIGQNFRHSKRQREPINKQFR